MKIAYCISSLSNSGGTERMVISKANALAERGHEVVFITTGPQNVKPFFSLRPEVRLINLPIDYNLDMLGSVLTKAIALGKLTKRHLSAMQALCDIEKFDVMIATGSYSYRVAARLKGSMRRIGETHMVHNFRLHRRLSPLLRLANIWEVRKDYKNISKLDAFVTLTEADRQEWKLPIPTAAIPNFIESRPDETSQCVRKRVIAVGRLSEEKGYDMLIKAWEVVNKTHPDWKLDIFGNGPLEKVIAGQISSSGLASSVSLKGVTKEIYKEMAEASLLVLPSRHESFGLVVIEAMACGLPVVAFDCPHGPKEILEGSGAGVLVPLGDTDALAGSINGLIDDTPRRRQMGEKGIELSNTYSKDNIIGIWERFLKGIVSGEPCRDS